jgi:hypothetical protein
LLMPFAGLVVTARGAIVAVGRGTLLLGTASLLRLVGGHRYQGVYCLRTQNSRERPRAIISASSVPDLRSATPTSTSSAPAQTRHGQRRVGPSGAR